MLAELMQHLMWRRRVRAAHAWRDAERQQAVEHAKARRRILDQAATIPSRATRW